MRIELNHNQGGSMLHKGDLAVSNEKFVRKFGIQMGSEKYNEIKKRLELLIERSPSQSIVNLHFDKGSSFLKGTLSIRSFSESFDTKSVGKCPMEVYSHLEEAIDYQLREWKRRRFFTNKGPTSVRPKQGTQFI